MKDKRILYGIIAFVVFFAIALGSAYLLKQRSNDTQDTPSDTTNTNGADNGTNTNPESPEADSIKSEKGVTIMLQTPARGAQVASPLKVAGSVPGNWAQEGQFSVRLLDGDSNVITQAQASINGDSQTENLVPFTANLTFETPSTGTGLLILEKANPSGLEAGSDSVTVLVMF